MQGLRRKSRLGVALRLAPLAAILAVSAVSLFHTEPPRAHLVPRAATGAMTLVDSLGGGAILTAGDMRPGSSAVGHVAILDASDLPAAVTLSESGLTSTSGLASWLTATVQDLTTGRTVYAGPLSAMGAVGLGSLDPRTAHDFRFVVTLRADAPNSLQSASASVRYDWTATPGSGSGSGSGGGSGTANPTGTGRVDTHAPALQLVGRWRQRLRPDAIVAYATCNEICTLSPSASIGGVRGVRRAPTTVAPATVARGQRALIRVSLTRKAMAKARHAMRAARNRGVRVVLIVIATDRGGNQTGATKTVVFTR